MKINTLLFAITALIISMNINAQNKATFTDPRDGENYKYLNIGKQVWMAENLRYASGKYIENSEEWADLGDNFNDAAYCWYNNNKSYKSTYGAFYTYAAAKNACPSGWHVPNDAAWSELESYLINAGYNFDGSMSDDKTAKSLASKNGWDISSENGYVGNNSESNNKTGFKALPTGFRDGSSGDFGAVGEGAYFWSTYTSTNNNAWYRYLSYNSESLGRSYGLDKSFGFSIRCIRD